MGALNKLHLHPDALNLPAWYFLWIRPDENERHSECVCLSDLGERFVKCGASLEQSPHTVQRSFVMNIFSALGEGRAQENSFRTHL